MAKKKNVRREDGRIAVQIYVGRKDGKRIYKTVYGQTQKEADQKSLEIRNDLNKGLNVLSEQNTFSEWADSFLNRVKVSAVSDGRYYSYSSSVKYLKNKLGDLPVKKIIPRHIQDIIDQLAEKNPNTKKPTAKRTLNFYLSTVHQVLQGAVKNKVILYNPATDIEIPNGAAQSHRRALTSEEQQWIIDTPHDRAQLPAMIMLYSGLRRGELMALTWNDIDLKKGTIQVNKTVAIKDGRFQLKDFTKSEAGMRTIDIPNRLVEFLRAEEKKVFASAKGQGKGEKALSLNPLVCTTAGGKLMSDIAWRRLWESYMTDLNFKYGNQMDKTGKRAKSKHNKNGIIKTIPPITAHWLRHTFATMLYMAGIDVLTARDQLGHSDIKTTLSIYTHLDKQFKRNSMAKLDEYLENKDKQSEKHIGK